jgi:hypothetical protein
MRRFDQALERQRTKPTTRKTFCKDPRVALHDSAESTGAFCVVRVTPLVAQLTKRVRGIP